MNNWGRQRIAGLISCRFFGQKLSREPLQLAAKDQETVSEMMTNLNQGTCSVLR